MQLVFQFGRSFFSVDLYVNVQIVSEDRFVETDDLILRMNLEF